MKMFGAFTKVEEQQDGTLLVEGIASTEAVDSDGEVVKATAIKAALPDFLKYGTGALREMHQPIAAGRVDTAAQADDGRTAISATVVDPVAIRKVKAGVYKGFSIGGKVTARDQVNKSTITGLRLTEISLVDRPANPEAVITLVKLEDGEGDEAVASDDVAKSDAGGAEEEAADPAQPAPAQVWDCRGGAMGGCEAHSHARKADAIACMEGQALKKRQAPLVEADAALKELDALTKGQGAATSQQQEGNVEGAATDQADATAPDQVEADVAMAAAIDDLEKAGARHGKADAARVQKLHDTAVELGADCGMGKHEHGDDLAKVQGDLAKVEGLLKAMTDERDQALEKLAVLTKAANTAAARIKELEAMPRAEEYVVKTAVALNGAGQEVAAPTTALDAIKKAQRSPARFGLAL
ncbi:HK97 family phage prohead protease [Nitrospirillum amazonense]|uniref:HK97 family phage prohead protease n=1 Tax=Nitrospirillum amazonense TaxID=28077 RepID=UPI002DD4423D|nr:HK97 family phage prohead protease [Nitrospirillum amazonense]MEC4591620.1 HK97 family phage prohead protease [Nitrospirillum amazonense]